MTKYIKRGMIFMSMENIYSTASFILFVSIILNLVAAASSRIEQNLKVKLLVIATIQVIALTVLSLFNIEGVGSYIKILLYFISMIMSWMAVIEQAALAKKESDGANEILKGINKKLDELKKVINDSAERIGSLDRTPESKQSDEED